jgi:ABC-2 type transport system permease protein
MNNTQALRGYLALEFTLLSRERVALVLTFILPAAIYAFFGMMFGQAAYGPEGRGFYEEYTASFLGLILLNTALMSVAPMLVIYKEMGFFRRLLVTPLDMSVVWLSSITRAFLMFLAGLAQMILVGWLMFDKLPSAPLADFTVGLLITAFSLFSFGFMLGSLFKSSTAVFNAGLLIFQPMLLLSGASVPLDQLPAIGQWLSKLVPMTYAVDVLRLSWRGELFTAAALPSIGVLLAIGLACALIARRTFRWSSK